MNSKNEKRFSRRLNIQVCELLQVLTEADIKKDFKKKSALGILKHNKQELKIQLKILRNMCEEVYFY